MRYISRSEKQTKEIARKLAKSFKGGVIGLYGEMGSGKTTFVQGFAKGLKIEDNIISPTFILVRQHKIPGKKATLYHIDLYRLDDLEDIKNLAVDNFLQNPQNIILIEWAEKAEKSLPKKKLKVYFKTMNENTREIKTI